MGRLDRIPTSLCKAVFLDLIAKADGLKEDAYSKRGARIISDYKFDLNRNRQCGPDRALGGDLVADLFTEEDVVTVYLTWVLSKNK
jgi:hypothetical protein